MSCRRANGPWETGAVTGSKCTQAESWRREKPRRTRFYRLGSRRSRRGRKITVQDEPGKNLRDENANDEAQQAEPTAYRVQEESKKTYRNEVEEEKRRQVEDEGQKWHGVEMCTESDEFSEYERGTEAREYEGGERERQREHIGQLEAQESIEGVRQLRLLEEDEPPVNIKKSML